MTSSPLGRREFLCSVGNQLTLGALAPRLLGLGSPQSSHRGGTGSGETVDRRARVDRHAPVVRGFDAMSVLSVGNGGFAFTVDATGLQTFPELHRDIPLATQAEWAWHSFANPSGYRLENALVLYDAHGRSVPYASAQRGAAGAWLRENPHRISLARIGLDLRTRNGRGAVPTDVGDIVQRLDLWTGVIESRFTFDGRIIHVTTCAHPRRDALAVRIECGDLDERVAVRIAFPYASAVHTGDPADWAHPDRHHTEIAECGRRSVRIRRRLDETTYDVRCRWSPACQLDRRAEHEFRLVPAIGGGEVEFTTEFATAALPREPLAFQETVDAARAHWREFWTSGGVADLSESSDSRAGELERRVVLSEYLTAIQCAGMLPPQETGETFDSWYGKFHLEMHWWHSAHFALWSREHLLERSLPWYRRILPRARETARRQGYRGARWPKMVGPDGRESPSTVGVFLVWQQPHPIYLSELVYRANPRRAFLESQRDVVFESAEFMASYPSWDANGRRFVLGPPLIPAQEIHPPATTFNPMFELAYWGFGLSIAQRWRERLGLPRMAEWDRVAAQLSKLPMRDGLYVNAESAPQTFSDCSQRRDHPTLLAAYGFIASPRADRVAMRRTLERVLRDWEWDTTWGWDYPLVAMTAARIGAPELAIEALLMDTPKNRYLPNGHNYQRSGLTIYLPGNGGLLAAIAMMAAGWDGAPPALSGAQGFPSGWRVRWEKLRGLP